MALIARAAGGRLRLAAVPLRSYGKCGRRLTTRASVPVSSVRNIGVIAHIDAGKTTTTERMLFYSGRITSMGEVHDGNTVTDYLPEERERGITIQSACTSFMWRDHQVNLVDTPGHVDFTVEVQRSLRVLDGAVAVVDAVAGVQAQTETVWRQADEYGVPRGAFVNKMDREGASLERASESLRHRLGARPLVLHMPLNEGAAFGSVVDLVSGRVLRWDEEDATGATFASEALDEAVHGAAVVSRAAAGRLALVESLADVDDAFADEFLEAEEPALVGADAVRRSSPV